MRKIIYQTVHVYDGSKFSIIYKWFMILAILATMIPLVTKEDMEVFIKIDFACLVIFIIDFILRWSCADYKFKNDSWTSFARYPFRLISIIDLLSIFALFCSVFGWYANSAISEVLKVFRIVRILRYSKNIRTIVYILKQSKKALIAVGSLAVGYILISALIIFNVEPESFNSFFDAVYWATVSLTTVGYGDIYPVSNVGRIVAMLSSFFGIAIVALPAGIITAGYLNVLKDKC
ncbi:MAG: ion transporter [Ruminococcaceae bacterium]|nr:ion transporter [Oscillospiraceae bacterium]